MLKPIVFCVVSALFIYLSSSALFRPRSHGFYRFFAWEFILALFLLNVERWYQEPYSGVQLVSWSLLGISLFFLGYGVYLLKVLGRPTEARQEDGLYAFEKTSSLVTVGIYRYIRHPLYSSLLLLAWGIFFKAPSWSGAALAVAASLFLFLTGKFDEAESLAYFGDDYRRYMQGTKRFVPFVF